MLLQNIDSIMPEAADSLLGGGRPFAMFLDDTGMETQMVEAANGGLWGYLTGIFQSEFFLGALTALLVLFAWENMTALVSILRERRKNGKSKRLAEDEKGTELEKVDNSTEG